MALLKKLNNRIKIHEGNTGILHFKNGEQFIPNYDIDKTIDLTLEILKDESLRSEETDKKIQYGLDLFGKYYTHLWD